jgi:predicted acylesterase/phospholipase RssA
MKRIFSISFVLIPLLCNSLAFSQPHQSIQKNSKSSVSATPVIGEGDYTAAPPKNYDSEDKYGAQRFPARGGSVDWGLALSGGGPRAAFFSIGVMKALI